MVREVHDRTEKPPCNEPKCCLNPLSMFQYLANIGDNSLQWGLALKTICDFLIEILFLLVTLLQSVLDQFELLKLDPHPRGLSREKTAGIDSNCLISKFIV